jgi:DNA-binding protein HU-beta
MNKGELVDKVAEKASVTKKEADHVITATIEAIMEAVSEGKKGHSGWLWFFRAPRA